MVHTCNNNFPFYGKLFININLSRFTTFKIGGMANRLYKPINIYDLIVFFKNLSLDEPLLWIGSGSNILIHDDGFLGTVIVTKKCLNNIFLLDDKCVYVEAGVSCTKLVSFCVKQNFSGIEFLSGIPGTIGGALNMNAGCFNQNIWSFVVSVEILNRCGVRSIRYPSDFIISYRCVTGLDVDEWFVSAIFSFSKGEKKKSIDKIKRFLSYKRKVQPIKEYNCGSIFKNPSNDISAGYLIESCNLKGKKIGGAMVSNKHANFIVNYNGNASFKDVKKLINIIKYTVWKKKNIKLETEVHILDNK
ncbi:UDP-N-acetylmuramate dehydrogenase [Candidatus Legionella polyplacis]|uniref:UDP-N-acetylenolpyruvoylglucosamine reductase n=1 Tax=Candidatus Legionella polyplacis TaxID=2005262 RepID=A0ABZ2GXN9_9GAMM